MGRRTSAALGLLIVSAAIAAGQNGNSPYVLKTFAGTFPLGDGGPAAQALLANPRGLVFDGSGNLYFLDGNYRLRKITSNGTISTVTQLTVTATDLKLGKDGNFYLAAPGLVFKVSPAGVVTTLAGNGTVGFGGDGGPAVNALVGNTVGIALDSAGNIFFCDATRIREITLDGNIRTVAGTGTGGYDGDNKPAVSAELFYPSGLAFDASNNLYVADTFSYRIRRISPNGIITTVAGNGNVGQPVNGYANATPMGVPSGLAVDTAGDIFIGDVSFGLILEVDANGFLTRAAGTPTFGTADGPAGSTYITNPNSLALDGSGNLFISDSSSARIRKLSGGNVTTIAGKLHYAGDGGPATSALFGNPADTAVDAQGNVFILDSSNVRIRKVTPDGIINTFAGNGLPGTPADGAQAASSPLPSFYAMAMDGLGNLYLGAFQRIFKITSAGVVTTLAGGAGAAGGSGDGGPATKAGFNLVFFLAADSVGNVYESEVGVPRIRKISAADGTVSTFAGSTTAGYAGDGGLATNASINTPAALATDGNGNVYIGDSVNNIVRMVNSAGIISTVAGNGVKGNPTDGAPAKSTPLTAGAGLAADASGNLYILSGASSIYRVDSAGLIHVISGGGAAAVADGLFANSTVGFPGTRIQVDGKGDLYVTDPTEDVVRKLVLDSPSGLAITDGNNQTAPAGSALRPVKVVVNGRGGVPVPGVLVAFAVTTGSATLSATSSRTDSSGTASVGVTLGAAAGNVTITAAIIGTTLPPVQFTATATISNSNCTVAMPAITSVKSLGDFGGFSTFGAGSWLEVKGTNLASNTRLWGGADFQGANAPISLDGSSVSINGIAGFVEYISSTQINVQAPADPATGAVQVMVTNCAGSSAPFTAQKVAMAPGMLAPASFNIGGKQYLVALYQDGVTFVGNVGLIAGVPFRPAKPGDLILTYGIGFGAVTPPVAPGVVVSAADSIPGLAISFGQTPAATAFAGLAPGLIGLYQFDITVPNVPDGDYQINVSVSGAPVPQTLYLTVHQ